MQEKMEELLVSDDCGMYSSPHRWVGFRRGFKAAYNLMQEQVKPLVEALRFYAEEDQYTATDIIDGVEVLEISSDQGDRAREALKGWEG